MRSQADATRSDDRGQGMIRMEFYHCRLLIPPRNPRAPGRILDRQGIPLRSTFVIIVRREFDGQLFGIDREVDVGSQVSGTVQSLHADFNSQVKAGDVLAQLDPSIFDSRLAQARAAKIEAEGEVQRAQVMARDAAVKAQRARELAARDLIIAAELETAEMTARQTEAELVAAKAAARAAAASVAEAEVNRERTTIRSPIDGLVISRTVEVGQTLAASVSAPTLFRVAAINRMHLLADVSEAEVGGVRPGSPVTFRVETLGDRALRGVVSEVRLQPMFTVATGGSRGTTSAPQPVGTAGPSSTSGSPSGSS